MGRVLLTAAVLLVILRVGLASPLTQAAWDGNLQEVQRLIRSGADVNSLDPYRDFALAGAVRQGHLEILKFLSEAPNVDLDLQDTNNQTALLIAACTQKPQFALQLLRQGAATDLQDVHGLTALHCAVDSDDSDLWMELLRRGANAGLQDRLGRTALMSARSAQCTGELLQHGVFVDARDGVQRTALMLARSAEIARVLLECGAAVNAQDKNGRSALTWVVRRGQTAETIRELLLRGAVVDGRDPKGRTALMFAQSAEAAGELLEHGAEVNAADEHGETALMHTVQTCHDGVAEELLSHGADLDMQSEDGATALHSLADDGRWCGQELLEAMLKAGADADARDALGRTPLWRATRQGLEEKVDVLLARGANAAIPAAWGQTPERLAATAARQRGKDPGDSELWLALLEATPGPLKLLETWRDLGLGLLLGLVGAGCLGARARARARGQGAPRRLSVATQAPLKEAEESSGEEGEGVTAKGAVLLAIRALAKRRAGGSGLRHRTCALLYCATTAVACALLPLGAAMLLLQPTLVIPLYLLTQVLPAALCLGRQQLLASTRPALILALTGVGAKGRARVLQAVVTLALLVVVWMAHWECRVDLLIASDCKWEESHRFLMTTEDGEGTLGAQASWDPQDGAGLLELPMVHMGQASLLNSAAAPIACGASDFSPLYGGGRLGMDLYLLGVFVTGCLWVPMACLEAAGHLSCQAVLPQERAEVAELAVRIAATESAAELEGLGLGVDTDLKGLAIVPESALSIGTTVLLCLLDLFVLDFLVIVNLVSTYNTKFAGALLAIVVTSLGAELLSGRLCRLPGDVEEARRRGFLPNALVNLLLTEKGLKAPLSLVITAYAFPFSVQGLPSFLCGLASLLVSVSACAWCSLDFLQDDEAASSDSSDSLDSDTSDSCDSSNTSSVE